jgi:methyl-accepting chemotaxis protein
MRFFAVPILASIALSTILATSACAERKKIGECNALIGVMNGAVDRIQQGARPAGDAGAGGKELLELATAMDQIAEQTGKLPLTVAELQQHAKDYQAMVREIAAASRELATALEKVNDESMKSAQAKLEKAVQREEPLVETVNKFCRAP